MSSTSNDIAITGANGFVGKNLRNFLHKNKIPGKQYQKGPAGVPGWSPVVWRMVYSFR